MRAGEQGPFGGLFAAAATPPAKPERSLKYVVCQGFIVGELGDIMCDTEEER
ncbi:hypothetical protein [Nocardia sp. NPDC005825]|uniref:hypothetical protein n=1 Tax=unclassified Nocardia TaxID=2637762 RepID=UPI003408FDF2